MVTYSPPRYLFRRHAIIKRLQPADKFLEIGAGNLQLASELSKIFEYGGSVIDFESDVKKYHKALPEDISSRIDLAIGDVFTLKTRDKYDSVISCEVMEHIKDDRAFLKKIYSLTKNGGQVIISVPAKQKYWSVHDEAVGHIKRYEKAELVQMFSHQGFKNIRVVSYGFPFTSFLMVLRIFHGKLQLRKKKNWSVEKRTKESGVNQVPKSFKVLGIVANKYAFLLPNLLSSLFDDMNLSEGYVVVAEK